MTWDDTAGSQWRGVVGSRWEEMGALSRSTSGAVLKAYGPPQSGLMEVMSWPLPQPLVSSTASRQTSQRAVISLVQSERWRWQTMTISVKKFVHIHHPGADAVWYREHHFVFMFYICNFTIDIPLRSKVYILPCRMCKMFFSTDLNEIFHMKEVYN